MSVHHLVRSVAKALASLYHLVIVPLVAFLPAPLAYRLALLRSNRRSQQSRFLNNKGFLNRLELALYHLVIVPLVAFLPAPLAYRLAVLYGDWRYRWHRPLREEVMRSLEGVLGDQLSPIERARVARDFFRLRSCEAIDVLRLAGKGRALARLVEIRGLEHIEAALAAGKGAIIASAHFGSYNPCFSLLGAYGFPITVIGLWPSNSRSNQSAIERFFYRQLMEKPLERHRRRPTIEPRAGQLGVAVQAASILRQNELIAICLDPPVYSANRAGAVPVNFLNGKALLRPGAITISQLMGAPVLMTFMRRSADWRHQVLEIAPPMPLDEDTVTAFGHCLAVVEAAIRRDLAHWFYWKELPPLVKLGLLSEEAINGLA